MKLNGCHIFFIFLFLISGITVFAQRPVQIIRDNASRLPGMNQQPGTNVAPGGGDSLQARNKFEDSITVIIYRVDSSRGYKLDSSISEFTKRYPIPPTHLYLGNTGTSTKSILFAPHLRSGWDHGFHNLDVYKWTPEKIRFFNTTRPYTEFGYMLASKGEQMIDVLHTQNIKPYWNFSLNYRLISSPGIFQNQKTNHNNYLFTSWYQSPSKRYNNYFIILANQLQTTENGGILSDKDYLDHEDYAKDRFLIPTKIGGKPVQSTDFFSSALNTGNQHRDYTVLLRQQYDLGKKDSLVKDSIVYALFYPRLRFEHTFRYESYRFSYRDLKNNNTSHANIPNEEYYLTRYQLQVPPHDSMYFRDNWNRIRNDFSIYQYPDARNLHQFFKVGAELELLKGEFYRLSSDLPPVSFHNMTAHAEYRNRTRNQKWDMVAFGRLNLTGFNAGNYHAFASLQRLLGKDIGSLKIGFENVNSSPSFKYDERSGFYLDLPKNFSNENTTHLFGSLIIPKLQLQLGADYYLISNYLYLTDFYKLQQEGTLFNVLRINALKKFRIGRRWSWYAEVYIQQKTGNAQINMPLLYTRNRLMYEGNLGFKNLDIAFGVESRYHTPYKADDYSPILGQFFYQDSITISNLPDVHAFLHFRIRSFKAYLRAENLNTARVFGGFQFNNNNLAAPYYPTPGLVIRFGIFWSFVN